MTGGWPPSPNAQQCEQVNAFSMTGAVPAIPQHNREKRQIQIQISPDGTKVPMRRYPQEVRATVVHRAMAGVGRAKRICLEVASRSNPVVTATHTSLHAVVASNQTTYNTARTVTNAAKNAASTVTNTVSAAVGATVAVPRRIIRSAIDRALRAHDYIQQWRANRQVRWRRLRATPRTPMVSVTKPATSANTACAFPSIVPPVILEPPSPHYRLSPPTKRQVTTALPTEWPVLHWGDTPAKETNGAVKCIVSPPTAKQRSTQVVAEFWPIKTRPWGASQTPTPEATRVDVTPPVSREVQEQRKIKAEERRLAREKEQAEADAQLQAEIARQEAEVEAVKRAEATQKEEATKREEERRHRREFRPLAAEWETKVEAALKNGHGIYSKDDMSRVVPQPGAGGIAGWLNDESINGYLNLVCNEGNKHVKRGTTPKHHAFNSFFMQTLMDKGPAGVLRWSKRAKVDGKRLLKVDQVYIPINSSSHWTLLVISPKTKDIRYYDSLGGDGSKFIDHAKLWLSDELNADIDAEWTAGSGISSRQNNMSDCGVFTVTSAKMLMLGGTAASYGPAQIPLQRRRMVAELIHGALL